MSPKRKREHQLITGILGGLLLVTLVGLGMLLITLMSGTSSSETAFLPTAQYLEQHPQEAPAFIHVDEDCIGSSRHCFRLQAETLVGRNDGYVFNDMSNRLASLNLQVNGHPVATTAHVAGTVIYGDVPLANLGDGVHLVEISVVDISGHIHRHSWAIRIGSAAGAAAPTLAVPPTHPTATP